MRIVKLDCFFENESCRIVSSWQNFQITSPIENNFILEINNLSIKDCELYLQAKNFTSDVEANRIELMLSQDKQLIYQANLADFFQQKIELGHLLAQTTKQYLFVFDLSHLFTELEKFSLNFDLTIDFNCLVLESRSTSLEEANKESSASVLSSNDSDKTLESSPSNLSLLASLSILFVLLLFAIIKIVHGKKKKK